MARLLEQLREEGERLGARQVGTGWMATAGGTLVTRNTLVNRITLVTRNTLFTRVTL